MDSPGIKNLGDVALAAINAATSSTVVTSSTDGAGNAVAYIDSLEGMLACSLQANLNYGSGGGTIKVIWATTLDQGATWIEVCRMALGAASEENVVNLSALTPKTTIITPAALSDDTCLDGVFGDRWRASILKASTDYAGNTSLSLRMNAR